jgi:hypothetical protein
MVWHAQKLSWTQIGVEIDGNPEGYPGYHWKPGGGPDPITDEQVRACDVLLEMLMDEFKKQGGKLKHIHAHRQSSENRECDPGWGAWEKIAIPWMKKSKATPGGDDWSGNTFGTGYHISKHWDKRSPVKGFRVK